MDEIIDSGLEKKIGPAKNEGLMEKLAFAQEDCDFAKKLLIGDSILITALYSSMYGLAALDPAPGSFAGQLIGALFAYSLLPLIFLFPIIGGYLDCNDNLKKVRQEYNSY